MNFLPDNNLTLDYYVNKLTLFLRKSYGITDHVEIFYGFIRQSNITLSNMFEQLDIMNVAFDYYTPAKLSEMKDNPTYDNKLLDYLADIFGVSRKFNIQYYDDNLDYHNDALNLSDYELLLLIRMMIIKNNFNGTFDDVKKFYNDVGFKIYMITDAVSGAVNVYLDNSPSYGKTLNIEKMFYAGLFTIESLGIRYQYVTTEIALTGVWNSPKPALCWYDPLTDKGGRWA